jgi:hypothetical protein
VSDFKILVEITSPTSRVAWMSCITKVEVRSEWEAECKFEGEIESGDECAVDANGKLNANAETKANMARERN